MLFLLREAELFVSFFSCVSDEKIFVKSQEPSSPLPVSPHSRSPFPQPHSPSPQLSSEPFSRRLSSYGHSATSERDSTEMSLLLHGGDHLVGDKVSSSSSSFCRRRSSLSPENHSHSSSSAWRSSSRRSRRESTRIETTAIHGQAPSSSSSTSTDHCHTNQLRVEEASASASFPYHVSFPSSTTVTSLDAEGPPQQPSNDAMLRALNSPTPHFLNSPSSSSSSSPPGELPVFYVPVSPRRHSDIHLSPENRPAEGDCDHEIAAPPPEGGEDSLTASPRHSATRTGDGSSRARSRRAGVGDEASDHHTGPGGGEEAEDGSFLPFGTRLREFSRWGGWAPNGLHIPTSIPIPQPLREARNGAEGPSSSSPTTAALGASTVMKKLFTTAGGGGPGGPPPPDYRRLCTNLWDDEGLVSSTRRLRLCGLCLSLIHASLSPSLSSLDVFCLLNTPTSSPFLPALFSPSRAYRHT